MSNPLLSWPTPLVFGCQSPNRSVTQSLLYFNTSLGFFKPIIVLRDFTMLFHQNNVQNFRQNLLMKKTPMCCRLSKKLVPLLMKQYLNLLRGSSTLQFFKFLSCSSYIFISPNLHKSQLKNNARCHGMLMSYNLWLIRE